MLLLSVNWITMWWLFWHLIVFSFQVAGKIVVYNQAWQGYSATAKYRKKGAGEASKRGAVAALVRSVTGYSQYTPHTGSHVSSLSCTYLNIYNYILDMIAISWKEHIFKMVDVHRLMSYGKSLWSMTWLFQVHNA